MAKIHLTLFIYILIIAVGNVHGLEALSGSQMKQAVAQAGISIAISDMPMEKYDYSLTIANPDDTTQYISLNGIHSQTLLNIGRTDVDGDGLIDPLSIDVGEYSDYVMVSLGSPDLILSTDVTIDGIDFCGTDLGSVSVASMNLSSVYLRMGPHESTGIDYELSHNLDIGSIAYQYNSTESLTLSGINVTGSFEGTLEDPTSWTTSGNFQIGNIENGLPATIDVSADTTESWSMTDSDGNTYTVSNPRYNNGYGALNIPMSGSIRIENISFGGSTQTDLGMIAIDGMNAEKLYIEIPGRGLGKP